MTRGSNEFTVRTYFQIVDSGDLGRSGQISEVKEDLGDR